jgi:RNA polymerase subunit RPABC4/transcription elongation factor Spt4
MQGYLATCPYCGRARGEVEIVGDDNRDETIRRLTLIPGVDTKVASGLYLDGIRDFADVIALSLPESERERGLHKILARRIIISELGKKKAEQVVPCGRCKGPVPIHSDTCPICGAKMEVTPEMKLQEIGDKVGEAVASIYGQLADDASFRSMPAELQEELVSALSDVDEEELLRQEYREQIEAWEEKGFDVDALRKLLDWDIRLFKEESVKLIQVQIQRRKDEGQQTCPLCHSLVPAEAEKCPNCDAVRKV